MHPLKCCRANRRRARGARAMSGGYADRLKHYPNKGVCGLPENYDSERLLKSNLRGLVELVRDLVRRVRHHLPRVLRVQGAQQLQLPEDLHDLPELLPGARS